MHSEVIQTRNLCITEDNYTTETSQLTYGKKMPFITILYCTHGGCRHGMRSGYAESCVVTQVQKPHNATPNNCRGSNADNSSLPYNIQGRFGLPIAFSTSLEGSVIEMKPAGPVPVDTTVSLKACHAITSERSIFIKKTFIIFLVMYS